jgi:membrane associated rhomboid family serine protease
MTIYDREYYRREGPSFLGAFANGQACKGIIIANAAVFVLQLLTDHAENRLTDFLSLSFDQLRHGEVWRLVTYAFAHEPGAWMHILFNMLFLWWFGTEIENLYGPREFLGFYFTAVVLSGLAFIVTDPNAGPGVIGASGAVTAVMVLFALHYPHHRLYIWFLFPIPIWLFVGFQVLQDTYVFAHGIETRTAVAAHLGGAVFGLLYFWSHWRIMNLFGWLPMERIKQLFRSQPRLRVYREEESQPVSVAAPPSSPRMDEHLEAQLDAILEKMSRSGRESLTEQEREILLRASEAYKRRRH